MPHSLTITQQPGGTPNPAASAAAMALSAAATDSLDHAVSFAWSASCAAALGGNGSFANGSTSTPTWTAPQNITGATQTCAIQVTADDGAGGLEDDITVTNLTGTGAAPRSASVTVRLAPDLAPNQEV